MTRPGWRQTAIPGVAVLLVVVFVLAWDHEFWANHVGLHRERNRQMVRAAYHELRLGMPAKDATFVLARLAAQGFTLDGSCQASGSCSALAPSEFGARNWVLYVELDTGRLSGARIRTADSVLEHPPEAPADLGEWREAGGE